MLGKEGLLTYRLGIRAAVADCHKKKKRRLALHGAAVARLKAQRRCVFCPSLARYSAFALHRRLFFDMAWRRRFLCAASSSGVRTFWGLPMAPPSSNPQHGGQLLCTATRVAAFFFFAATRVTIGGVGHVARNSAWLGVAEKSLAQLGRAIRGWAGAGTSVA